MYYKYVGNDTRSWAALAGAQLRLHALLLLVNPSHQLNNTAASYIAVTLVAYMLYYSVALSCPILPSCENAWILLRIKYADVYFSNAH